MNRQLTIFLAAAAAFLLLLFSATYIVMQSTQVLVLQFGNPVRVVSEPGLYFKIPFIQDVQYMDKRILNLKARPEEVIAEDQKRLVVDSYARFKIVNPLLFYQTVRRVDNARERLGALINSSLRGVLGSQPFAAMLSAERADLMHQIKTAVNGEAKALGIEIVDVRILRADLPEANSQAVFRRMQTEREREAAEFRAQGREQAEIIRATAERERTILLADAQRQAAVTRGEGDGAAAKVAAQSFGQDPDFYAFYRSMQAYRETLQNGDTVVLSPNSEFFKYMGSK